VEGYTLKKRELIALTSIADEADSAVLITEQNGDVHLSYSKNLSEMEVLDLLSLVTSKFYEIADEGDSQIH